MIGAHEERCAICGKDTDGPDGIFVEYKRSGQWYIVHFCSAKHWDKWLKENPDEIPDKS